MIENIKKAQIAILETAQDMDTMMISNAASFNSDEWDERRSIINSLNEAKAILESVNSELQLFEEKATTEQYRLKKFKQKYHYDPAKKTIVVDGETYKVDLDNYKSGTRTIKRKDGSTVTTIRSTALNQPANAIADDDLYITLGNDFFKTKNTRRQDATLQHEIGHAKLHASTVMYDYDKGSSKVNSAFKNAYRKIEKEDPDRYSGLNKKRVYNEVIRVVKYDENKAKESATAYNECTKKLEEDMMKAVRNEMNKQAKNIDTAKKYVDDREEHSNTREFEADRYSANRTSKKDMKASLREGYKHTKKNYNKAMRDIAKTKVANGKSKESADRFLADAQANKDRNIHEYNKQAQADMNSRSKALNDKDLANADLYKKKK